MGWSLDRTLHVVAVTAALAIAAAGFLSNQAFYHDDAFISLRYARNLASGDGLVWNPGERVEGYTSPLHTLSVAVLGAAGVDLITASRAVNALAYAALLLFLLLLGPPLIGQRVPGRTSVALPFVLVVASFPLIVWVLGGLEGPLFTALSASGIWLLQDVLRRGSSSRALATSGVLLGLASVTRMDGLLFVAIALPFLLAGPGGVRKAIVFSAAALAVLIPFSIWRQLYYGSILPNTFWCKATAMSLDRLRLGRGYVQAFVMTPPYTVVLAGAAALWLWLRGALDRGALYVAGVVAAYLAYVACMGGDHMPAFRLLLPVIPQAALLVGMAAARLDPPAGRLVGRAALLGVVVLVGLQIGRDRLNPRDMDPAAFVGTIVGKYIESAWPPGSLVALNTAGSTPYFAEHLRFVDMLGLNDAHIARRSIRAIEVPLQAMPGHLKGDGAYVLSRAPDYVIIGPAEGVTIEAPWFLSDLEISRDPHFLVDYELIQKQCDVVTLPGHERYAATRTGVLIFTYYRRRDAPHMPSLDGPEEPPA